MTEKRIAMALLMSTLIAFAAPSQVQPRTDTLSRWYATENDFIVNSTNSLYQLLNAASRECVEGKLKLAELGNNTYDDEDYIQVLITKAFELCVENQAELWRMRAEEYLHDVRYGWYNEDESIECLKQKIRETEPYSSILKDDSEGHSTPQQCNVEPHIEWSHDLLNDKASPHPCFVRSRNAVKFDNIYYKLRIIEFGAFSEARKSTEMESIGGLLGRMADMNYRCLIRFIE